METGKILVVEDDPKILKILEHLLKREGYKVYSAMDGLKAVSLAEKLRPNLVLLDLMIPLMDGFEVCKRIKTSQDVPVIILSARGEEVDKVVGFTLGADDYQTKPFSPTELVMRVKAVLRRYSKTVLHGSVLEELTFKDLQISAQTRTVKVRGIQVELTAKEFDLLWHLASGSPRVFSRQQLLEALWESDFFGDENTLTVHIRRLREKVEEDSTNPRFIKTVWGVGYKFEPDVSA